jgi:RimJ/RimL family protein N-acetyltransferase
MKNLNLQPTLRGELIELRPLREDDFEAVYEAASDPLIWEQHPETTRYKREVFQDFFDSAMASKGAFAVIERASGRVIGSSRYCNLTPDGKEIEIGWTFLERKFWGRAYNREMKRLMLEHALPHVDRVVFVIGENNMRSRKAVEKIGAKFWKKMDADSPRSATGPRVIYAIENANRLETLSRAADSHAVKRGAL